MPDSQSSFAISNQSVLPVVNLDPDGQVAEHRLKNPTDAQSMVAMLWQAAQSRNLRNAAIQGQIDGNPPYSPSKLRQQGRAGDPNFNTLEAKALLSGACVPYFDLFAGEGRYVDFSVPENSPFDQQKIQRWINACDQAYDTMLKRWQDYEFQMQQMQNDFVAYGKGFLSWEDSKSWRVQKIAHYRVLVPDATPISMGEWEIIVVLQDWPVTKLYQRIRDESAAKRMGWDCDEVYRAISMAMPTNPNAPLDPISAQQALRDSDISVSYRASLVRTATVFVREFDGKWSQLMVRRDQVPTSPTTSGDEPATSWMFEARSKFDSVLDCLVPFFYEAGSTSWNGAAGLGRDIFTAMQLKDRLACAQAQAVFLRSSLVLQPRQALDRNRMNAIQVGAITWLPDGVEVLQSAILGDINSTIEVSRELDQTIQRNTGIYRPQIEKAGGNPQTLGEFNAKFAQATVLSTAAINRFYSQLDRFYQAQFKRVMDGGGMPGSEAAKEAKMFRDTVLEMGVPEEFLDSLEIRAWRNIGSGSQAMRQQTLQGFMGLYPLLKPQGQEALLRDIIGTAGSISQTRRYMPVEEWAGMPNDQQELALLENAAIKIGMPVTWTPSNNNIIHAQMHLQSGAQALESLQQGADPATVLHFLDGIGAHTLVHLQRESANPMTKDAQAILTKQWKDLAQTTDQLKSHVQAQMQAQQAQAEKTQQVLSDQQLAQLETEGKLKLSQMKAAGTLQLKAQNQQFNNALKAQKQGVDIGLADASTAAEIRRANAKTVHDMTLDQLEAAGQPESGKS